MFNARIHHTSGKLRTGLLVGVAAAVSLSTSSAAWADCTGTFTGAALPAGFKSGLTSQIGSIAGTVSAISEVIGTLNTAFLAQGSAFVTSPSGRNPDETNGGVWIRTIGGRLDTQSTGSSGVTVSGPGVAGTAAGNINCNSDIRQDYAGVQVGQDLARLNLNGSGANLHFGVTTGWANTKFQDLSALGGTTGNVEVPFVGMYSALAWGNFFADVLARWDFYQMSLFSPTASLTNQRLDAHGFSISASAGYKIDVGNNWFVEPSASIIHSVTSVDQLNLAYGFGSSNTNIFIPATAVQFSDIDSTLGRAGVRFGTSFTAGNLLVQPFVTVSVWHEFAGNTAASLLGNDFLNQINIAGNVSTTRIGTYGQYSAGAAAQVVGTSWFGYLRVDYRNGSNIEGLGINGGLRRQFDLAELAAPAGIYKAPVKAVAAPYDWTGAYIGGFVGSDRGKTSLTSTTIPVTSDPSLAGILIGGQVGYNYQTGHWVFGVEGDAGSGNAAGGKGCFVPGTGNVFRQPLAGFIFNNCDVETRVLATATARLGYAWDRALLYGKAGAAWSDNRYVVQCNTDATFVLNPCLFQSLTATNDKLGWTVGVGLEYAFAAHWSAKIEYDHLDFGTANLGLTPNTSFVTTPQTLQVKQSFDQVKIGLNYHFSDRNVELAPAAAGGTYKAPPAPVTNWSGFYAGLLVGDRFADADWKTLACATCFPPPPVDITTTPSDFFSASLKIGGFAGFNWQVAPKWVVGAEGDIAWTDSSMSQGGIPGTFGNGRSSIVGTEALTADSSSVRFGPDGSVRARVGFLPVPNLLLFATAGVAFQAVEISATCDGSNSSQCFAPHNETFSTVKTGWTVGAGAEAALTSNWFGRLEYRYADYGSVNHVFFAGTGDDVTTAVRLTTRSVLAGLAYKFDWAGPVVAKY